MNEDILSTTFKKLDLNGCGAVNSGSLIDSLGGNYKQFSDLFLEAGLVTNGDVDFQKFYGYMCVAKISDRI